MVTFTDDVMPREADVMNDDIVLNVDTSQQRRQAGRSLLADGAAESQSGPSRQQPKETVILEKIDYGSMGIFDSATVKKLRNDPNVPLKTRLKLWHAMFPTDFLNLLGSVGAKESVCLIHAESLIVHVVCSAEKEGNVLLDFAKGPQTLQLVYRVERILSGITRCGGTYQLVFFDVFKQVFDPAYAVDEEDEGSGEATFFDGYLLLREILLTHVKLNGLPHLVFNHWYDAQWLQYLQKNDPTCILIEEGSSFLYKYPTIYETVDSPGSLKPNASNMEVLEDFNLRQKKIDRFTFATQCLAINCLTKNISVAYFFEIGPYAQNFKAFISFSSHCYMPQKLLMEVKTAFLSEYPALTAEAPANDVPELIAELKQLGVEPRLRQLVACNYIKNLMKMKNDTGEDIDEETKVYIESCMLTFRILLIHNYLLDSLPLSSRCTRRIETEDWDFFTTYMAATLDLMASTTTPVLNGISKALDQMDNSKKDVADLFDGNLFTSLLQCMALYAKEHNDQVDAKFLNLPEAVSSEMDKVFSSFTGISNSTLFPIDMKPFAEHGIYDCVDALNSFEKEPESNIELLHLENNFVNMYFGLKKLGQNLSLYEGKNEESVAKFIEMGWRDPATISEKTECIDFFLKAEVKDKQANTQKRTQKQEQRSMQRQTAFAHLLSRYMGSSNLHHPLVPKLEHHWLDVKLKALEEEKASNKPEAVAAHGKGGRNNKGAREKPAKENKKDKPGKVKTSSKAEILRQKHTATQENKSREADMRTLERFSSRMPSLFSPDHTFDSIYTNILEYTAGPNRAVDLTCDFRWVKSVINTKPVQLQFLMKMIETLYSCYEGYRMRAIKGKALSCTTFRRTICITIRLIHDCFNEFNSLIDGPSIMLMQRFLLRLGMNQGAKNIFDIWSRVTADKKSKQYKLEKEEPFDFAVPKGNEYDFQLAYMGDWMERTLGSTDDPRVLFKPDAWQKVLLDVVDERESALVVAPTSTGKTFICYYAMEQGLRLDDDGIVIFVSPNNALALQVTYEITARFSSKSYSTTSCASVLSAAFLEKFHNPKWNCAQILVTVPEILEQLLIAMRSSELGYAKRIEYIILDEIHCLAEEDMGPFLERVIHLSAAPFLALSATVGNPTQFHQWLSKVERVRRNSESAKVHYIYFDERFSDLKLELYSNRQLTPLNPATCLSFHTIKTVGMPKDLYLIPKDLMLLRRSISLVVGNRCPDLEYLEPAEYFRGSPIITKRQYRFWLHTFVDEFTRHIQDGSITEDDFKLILAHLNAMNTSISTKDETSEDIYRLYPLLKIPDVKVNKDGKKKTPQTDDNSGHLRDYLDPEAFLSMLHTMDQAKRLPCLAFTFDRNHMEHILMSVTQLLVRKQWEKYYGTPEAVAWTNAENRRRMDNYQMLMRQYEAEKKMRSSSREQREEHGLRGKVEDFLELPEEPVNVAEDYDPEFNFYNRKIYVNYTDEIENFIRVARFSISDRKNVDVFLEGLRRGIGIHHEGLPHKFTMLTETLFRMGFIRVLLSGRSLAFGINVPCKSVIFLGDNHELTPLMYKQMSGRCGRRGFDLSGHVVFWGIPKKRMRQLLTAQLANLCGHSSCSPTEVLATLSAFTALCFYVKTKPSQQQLTGKISTTDAKARKMEIIHRSRESVVDPRLVVKRLASIFMNPLKPQSGFSADEVLIFRACVEILFSLGFIDKLGSVRGCCELALLTRDAHPTNLFLAHVVQLGRLHGKEGIGVANSPEKLIDLLSRFCYKKQQLGTIFTLRRLLTQKIRCGVKYNTILTTNIQSDIEGDAPSVEISYPDYFPLLPAVAGELREVLNEYNNKVMAVLSKYQSKLAQMEPRLPLSNVDFSCNTDERPSWFTEKRKNLVFESLSSPFVGINGIKGQFKTSRELWLSSRACSEITFDMVPTIEYIHVDVVQLDSHYNVLKKLEMSLDNSYIIDYWTHGKFSYVRDVSGLGQYGWFHLRKIVTLLKLFKLTLDGYTDSGILEDPLHSTVTQVLDRYENLFNRI